MKINQGFVIALDGPDGVGKTTQVQLLAKYLTEKGYVVHKTRSSGGTPIGEVLRSVSRADIPRPAKTDLHISLAMGEALGDDIQARKKKGEIVIIDRSPLTLVAYNGYGSNLSDKKPVFKACLDMIKHWRIDKLILLHASPQLLQKRLDGRVSTKDYFEKQPTNYHQRVRKGYDEGLRFLQHNKKLTTTFTVVDANTSIDEVHRQIVAAIE